MKSSSLLSILGSNPCRRELVAAARVEPAREDQIVESGNAATSRGLAAATQTSSSLSALATDPPPAACAASHLVESRGVESDVHLLVKVSHSSFLLLLVLLPPPPTNELLAALKEEYPPRVLQKPPPLLALRPLRGVAVRAGALFLAHLMIPSTFIERGETIIYKDLREYYLWYYISEVFCHTLQRKKFKTNSQVSPAIFIFATLKHSASVHAPSWCEVVGRAVRFHCCKRQDGSKGRTNRAVRRGAERRG